MSTKLEELEKRWGKANELIGNLDRYCCGTSCSSCIIQQKGGCGATQAKARLADLEAEIRAERNRVKTIEEVAKTREEMTKAMLSVKRDDWDIVNISYAEDDTTAVAFIKKGTELKPNMEPVNKRTGKDRVFELANKIKSSRQESHANGVGFCDGVNCHVCPLFSGLEDKDGHTCIISFVERRFSELDREGKSNA